MLFFVFFFFPIKDLEKQEELRIAHLHLKEDQEIIDKLRGIVSERAEEISNMQMDLENSDAKLQEKVLRGSWGLYVQIPDIFLE